jgi:hypothetical protein
MKTCCVAGRRASATAKTQHGGPIDIHGGTLGEHDFRRLVRFYPFSERSLTIMPAGLAMQIPMRISVRVAYSIWFCPCVFKKISSIRYSRGDVEGHGAHGFVSCRDHKQSTPLQRQDGAGRRVRHGDPLYVRCQGRCIPCRWCEFSFISVSTR